MEADQRVAVAYITRTKGVRGEVRAEVLTHTLRRFDLLREVIVQKEGCPDRELRLERWRPEPPAVLLKFAGVDSPEVARQVLVRGYVTVAAEEVLPLPEDVFYVFDLIGCAVESESGERLGKIVDVLPMPSTDVYQVQSEQGEFLLPAVGDFIAEISVAEKRLVVRGIEELLPSP